MNSQESESGRVTFEHRDENKSCSACQEWLNERLNECESEKEWDSEREWEWERVRVWPGSQLLSDVQSFFVYYLVMQTENMTAGRNNYSTTSFSYSILVCSHEIL